MVEIKDLYVDKEKIYPKTSIDAIEDLVIGEGISKEGGNISINVKTINGNSIVGEGDLVIKGGDSIDITYNGTMSGLQSNNIQNAIDELLTKTLLAEPTDNAHDYSSDYSLLLSDITNNLGYLENKIMSQKAVTEALQRKTVNHITNNVTIKPNVLNLWGEVENLFITLDSDSNPADEFMIQFTSGNNTTLTFVGSDIKWLNAPVINSNKIYQISIMNNLGVIGEFVK